MNDLSEGRFNEMMELLEFPDDAISDLLQALRKITNIRENILEFQNLLEQYHHTVNCDYPLLFKKMRCISQRVEIHPYTGDMLLLLGFCKSLYARFAEAGYSRDLFCGTMLDLKYKLIECKLIYKVYGTFVADWFIGYFRLERFGLGRLQFELIDFDCSCECSGITLYPGTKTIRMHIPRTGTALNHDAVLDSYRKAMDFYQKEFEGNPFVFQCDSWLLYPWNFTVLPEHSNIRAFASDFTLFKSGNWPDYSEVWRLFDCLYTGDAGQLPQDTSLRRAYAQRIQEGKPLGWGRGVFLMNQCI